MKKTSFLFLLTLILLFPRSNVFAQSGIQVLENEIVHHFPDGMYFYLSATSDVEIESVILLYGTDQRTCQSGIARQSLNFEPGSELTLDWEWEWKRSGILPPGTEVWWQWEIVDASGEILTTPKETIIVRDQRHNWKSIDRNGVIVQWYVGDDSFGESIHNLAVESLGRNETDMGLQIEEDIHITVYPNSGEVRTALLVTTEWTGGVAFPDHNSMIIGVGPHELDWAEMIIPHELNHLVVGALFFNCKGVRLPRWLSEGLAEMAEGPLAPGKRDMVISALEDNRLPALTSLARSFSAYGDDALLSYVQSRLVVQFLFDEFGAGKVSELLAIMQAGEKIDSALEQVYGFDTSSLDAAWRASLGFSQVETSQMRGEATVTPTLVPTLPPIAPVHQATATSTPAPTLATSTPTLAPTGTAVQPTSTVAALPTDSLPPTPADESQNTFPVSLYAAAIIGITLVSVIAFTLLKRRN